MLCFEIILSITSLIMLWFMGNKAKYAPLIGVINQILWIAFVLSTKQYGLLPGVVAFAVVHVRNYSKWN